ncbi:MAG: DUF4878 domain-containing protein [Mycobacterium sp.]
MSNPSGTDRDDVTGAAGPDDPSPAQADPVTEVIDVSAITEPADDPAERRYTAPGFDAGSTQIIDRVPDPPTQVFTSTGIQPDQPHRRTPRRKLVIALGVAAAVILGSLLTVFAVISRVSQEDRVRSVIQTFDTAVQRGDLATLREVTCGQTREAYAAYDERSWADAYSKISSAKQYPVVASVDDVVINGDHAEANVTSYMAFDPATMSTRSFDLQRRDDQWRICQAF